MEGFYLRIGEAKILWLLYLIWVFLGNNRVLHPQVRSHTRRRSIRWQETQKSGLVSLTEHHFPVGQYLVAHPTDRKWVTTLVISPLITGVITHLLSGMNHQVDPLHPILHLPGFENLQNCVFPSLTWSLMLNSSSNPLFFRVELLKPHKNWRYPCHVHRNSLKNLCLPWPPKSPRPWPKDGRAAGSRPPFTPLCRSRSPPLMATSKSTTPRMP